MSRRFPSRRSLLFVAVLASAVTSAGVASASALPRAASNCNIRSSQRSLGPTYVTSLRVTNVNCATGKNVVKAYYRCRVSNGGPKGTCHKRVLGYTCTEHRQGIKVQFDATVSCVTGSKRVDHTYTQNT